MQTTDQPKKISIPFATNGIKRNIPNASQIGVVDGAASYPDGFPQKNFLPLAAGGIPPAGADFNGVLNEITAVLRWQAAGALFRYDAEFAATVGGYPKGCRLSASDGVGVWVNQVESNLADPNNPASEGWLSLSDSINVVRSETAAVAHALSKAFGFNVPTVFDFMTNAQIADAKLSSPTLDHTSALQAALTATAGKALILGPYNFRATAGLLVRGTVLGLGGNVKFSGVTISKLINQTAEGSLLGFTIDGAQVTNCEYGLFVDTDFAQSSTCKYDLKIVNIANGDNTKGCNGATFYKSSSATVNPNTKLDIKIDVDTVTATANSTVGDSGGASCGILVSFNGVGTDSHVVIRDSVVKNILPVEDSAGIQTYTADHTTVGALGNFSILNCKTYNTRKRGVKVQSQNTIVRDVTVFGQNNEIGFDTYAVETLFENCRYRNGAGTSFRTSGINTRFYAAKGEASTQQPMLRLDAGAVGPALRDCSFTNSATLGSNDNNIVYINGVAYCTFDNCSIACTSSTGVGFSVGGTCDIKFRGGSIGGTYNGVLLAFSSGSFSFTNGSTMNVSNAGVVRTGSTSQVFVGNDSAISAAIGLNLVGGGISATAELDNCKLSCSNFGLIVADGSRVLNCQVTSPNTTGTAISAGNSVVRNNRITKYAIGVDMSYSTTAEVSDNVAIGTTSPYVKTGYTAFVDIDNFSR